MFKQKINYEKLPNHIGIIMDGNGRWAKKRGMPRNFGHRAGIEAVKETIKNCDDLKIKMLTLFAFSTENWNRDKEEIDGIFNLIREHLTDDLSLYKERNIKFMSMGDHSKLPQDLTTRLHEVIDETKDNTGMIVNVAMNYGARQELVMAVNKIIESGEKKVDEKTISKYLYTSGLPDPDLVIRTSGEQRLSNFMLFQIAYSELYFPQIHWPDFDKKALMQAIIAYEKRERRFGGIKQEKK